MSMERISTVDEKGNRVVVLKLTPDISVGSLREPNATIQGLPEYQLENGSRVNVKGDEFQVVSSGQRLRRT